MNPFDEFSRAATDKIIKSLCSPATAFNLSKDGIVARYTNEFTTDKLLSFTRLIQSLHGGDGEMCFYQPLIHLLFHEVYGNWHAWRFALVFEDIKWTISQGPSLTSILQAE